MAAPFVFIELFLLSVSASDVADVQAAADELGLSGRVTGELRHVAATATALKASGTEDDACTLVYHAASAARRAAIKLSKLRDAARAKGGDAGKRFDAALARLSVAVKGIAFRSGAEAVEGVVLYAEIDALVPAKAGRRSLLLAVQGWARGYWPVYLTQLRGIQGCTELGDAAYRALTGVNRAWWDGRRSCFPSALWPDLNRSFEALASTCYCASKSAATADAAKIAWILGQFQEPDWIKAAAALKAAVSSRDAQFDGKCAVNNYGARR